MRWHPLIVVVLLLSFSGVALAADGLTGMASSCPSLPPPPQCSTILPECGSGGAPALSTFIIYCRKFIIEFPPAGGCPSHVPVFKNIPCKLRTICKDHDTKKTPAPYCSACVLQPTKCSGKKIETCTENPDKLEDKWISTQKECPFGCEEFAKEITYMTKFGGGRGSATFARCKKPIKCPKNVNKGDIICKDNNLFLCSKKNTFLRHSTCKQGTHCQDREIKLSSRVLHKAKCVADET